MRIIISTFFSEMFFSDLKQNLRISANSKTAYFISKNFKKNLIPYSHIDFFDKIFQKFSFASFSWSHFSVSFRLFLSIFLVTSTNLNAFHIHYKHLLPLLTCLLFPLSARQYQYTPPKYFYYFSTSNKIRVSLLFFTISFHLKEKEI